MLPFAAILLAAGLAAAQTHLEFATVTRDVMMARLKRVSHKPKERMANLKLLFEEAGCKGEHVAEQPVKGVKFPNLTCTLPGAGHSTIIVGAHYDHWERLGAGAVDNWSGATMLPNLYEALAQKPRRHRFVFAGFTAEEKGLVGSRWFAERLSAEELTRIRAYVNIDCIGLGPPKVWVNASDPQLTAALLAVGQALQLKIGGVNVDKVAADDSRSFAALKVPVVSIHSVTQQNIGILHSLQDQLPAIQPDDYYNTAKLIGAFLAYLDMRLDE